MDTKKQPLWKRVVGTGGWSFLTVLSWELAEEALESLIALVVSNMIGLLIIKALYTAGILVVTQTVKVLIKRYVFPIVKALIYKEGNDKMKLLKNYWTLIRGNKFSGLFAGVGFGLVSYYQTFIGFATHCWWIALIVGLIFFNLGIFIGGESLQQIVDRIAEKTKNKDLKKQLKKVQKAQEIVDKYEAAKKTIAEAPQQPKE